MLGTIVNTGTILIGSLVGSVIRKGIKDEYKDALFNAMGLAAAGLGINAVVQNMPKSNYPVLFIAALAIGSLLGTILNIDGEVSEADRAVFGKKQIRGRIVYGNTVVLHRNLVYSGAYQQRLIRGQYLFVYQCDS